MFGTYYKHIDATEDYIQRVYHKHEDVLIGIKNIFYTIFILNNIFKKRKRTYFLSVLDIQTSPVLYFTQILLVRFSDRGVVVAIICT